MNRQSDQASRFRGGLLITPTQMQQAENLIRQLYDNLRASIVLLCEHSGQVIVSHLDNTPVTRSIDITALGALAAADLAAGQEIAQLTNESQEYPMVMREGPGTNLIITRAGKRLVLLAKMDSATLLGMARLDIQQTASDLDELLAISAPEPSLMEPVTVISEVDFTSQLDSSMDALWTEEEHVR